MSDDEYYSDVEDSCTFNASINALIVDALSDDTENDDVCEIVYNLNNLDINYKDLKIRMILDNISDTNITIKEIKTQNPENEILHLSSRIAILRVLINLINKTNDTERKSYLEDSFVTVDINDIPITKKNEVILTDMATDIEKIMIAMQPIMKKRNIISRLIELIRYVYTNYKYHCRICIRLIGRSICQNSLCRFNLIENKQYYDINSILKEGKGPVLEFLLHCGKEALRTNKVMVLLKPLPQKYTSLEILNDDITQVHLKMAEITKAEQTNSEYRFKLYTLFPDNDRIETLLWWLLNKIPFDYTYHNTTDWPTDKKIAITGVIELHHPKEVIDAYNDTKHEIIEVYHGSRGSQHISIMSHGLQNLSFTEYMSTGAAEGEGIYTSKEIQVSLGYTGSRPSAIYQLYLKKDPKGVKIAAHHVITNPDLLLIRNILLL